MNELRSLNLRSRAVRSLNYTMAVANALLDGAGRFERLMIDVTRGEIESRHRFLQAVGPVRDPLVVDTQQAILDAAHAGAAAAA